MTFENGTEIMVDINNINHVEVISDDVDNHKVVDFADINRWLVDAHRPSLDEYAEKGRERIRKEYIGHTLETMVDYFNK